MRLTVGNVVERSLEDVAVTVSFVIYDLKVTYNVKQHRDYVPKS